MKGTPRPIFFGTDREVLFFGGLDGSFFSIYFMNGSRRAPHEEFLKKQNFQVCASTCSFKNLRYTYLDFFLSIFVNSFDHKLLVHTLVLLTNLSQSLGTDESCGQLCKPIMLLAWFKHP